MKMQNAMIFIFSFLPNSFQSELINQQQNCLYKNQFQQNLLQDIINQNLNFQMQTAKQSLLFKHYTYEIQINPMGEKRLCISIIDSSTKSEFFQKELVLEQIGVSTLIKAFEKAKKQISFKIDHKKGGEIQMIELKVQVQSQFLRPVQETIYIKKLRDVSEAQALKKSIDYLNKKMKDLKASQDRQGKDGLAASIQRKEKLYSGGSTFEPFSQITLPKGKHLITWTFLAKATNQLMYMYLNQGQVALLTNCAVYVPNNQNFVPYTYRKVHTVTTNEQTLTLQTYCTSSYPVTISNCIVTAKRLD